jgi:hypothetical protein
MQGTQRVFRSSSARVGAAVWLGTWLLWSSCDGIGDDSAGPDARIESCSGYARESHEVIQSLSGSFFGSIADSGGEVPCRYDESSFELTIELESGSACADESFCPEGPFSCALSGSIVIDDARPAEVGGQVYILEGASAGLSVALSSSGLSASGEDPVRVLNLQGIEQSRSLGRAGARSDWEWKHSSEDSESGFVWERCTMTIDEVRPL